MRLITYARRLGGMVRVVGLWCSDGSLEMWGEHLRTGARLNLTEAERAAAREVFVRGNRPRPSMLPEVAA